MKRLLMLVLFMVFCLVPFAAAKDGSDSLPFAAGLCANKAGMLVQEGKPEDAVTVLEAFRTKNGRETHYYIEYLLGNCLMMIKTQDSHVLNRAADAYERALKKKPDFSSAWLNLAQSLYSLGKMDGAAAAFIKGYDTAEKKQAISLYYGAACLFFAKQNQQALAAFNRLLARHRDEVRLEWKEIYVNTLFALDKNREALPWLKELAEKSTGKKQRQWQEVLLYQYLTLKMDKAALDYAVSLTRSDPGEPKWWKALAHIHLDANRMEKGLRSLMIYGFLTPLSPPETALLADLYSACNIPLEAARYYEAWVAEQTGTNGSDKADPKNVADKIFRIAAAYMRGGDDDAALAWIDKGLAMQNQERMLRLKADLLFKKKKYDEACTTYLQLAEFKKEQGRAQLMAGYSAWNMDHLDDAARYFAMAAVSPGQKAAAQNALAQIKKILAAKTE